MEREDRTGERPGLVASATSLARNALGLALTRIELAALELGEARGQLMKLLLTGLLCVLAACFALGWGSVLIVVLAWPLMGWTILAAIAAVFALAAWLLYRRLMALLAEDKLGMPATMAELRKDRDALM